MDIDTRSFFSWLFEIIYAIRSFLRCRKIIEREEGGYNRREIKKKRDGFSDSSVMHPGHFANINGFIFFTLLKLSGSKNVYDYSTTRRKSGRRLSKLYNQRSPIPPPPFPKRTYTSLLSPCCNVTEDAWTFEFSSFFPVAIVECFETIRANKKKRRNEIKKKKERRIHK